MFARLILATLAATTTFNAQAAPEWVALADTNTRLTLVNQFTMSKQGQYVDVEVMRDFTETITLGNDAQTGAPLYPHRSVTLTYKVDCVSEKLAVSEWQMFDGNLGQGNTVWDQKNRSGLAFISAVDSEMRAVLRSACNTPTVSR